VIPCPVVKANVSIFKKLKRGKVILDFGDIWFSQRDPRVYKITSTWYLNAILANFVDYVVMPTMAMTEFVLKLLPSQLRNKVVHIPSAIDTRIVRPTRKASRPRIAYIGSLVGGRIEMLPYIAKKTIAQCKDVEFVVIGSGPMREWLRKKAGEFELERNFTLIGDVKFSELPRVCGDCWVGLSSVREETIYPIDILKSLVYMSLGMPIIASRIIEEASDVLVRTRPDPLSFANAICSLVRNYSLIEELSQRARDRAAKFYDVGVISNKYHNLLAS
jgi:glycosyltransferase involved in cell wall biosynthesis